MADKLTPQQAMAVNDRGGKLLVSAAAGSGKTKVLVDRLLKYLTDPNDPANLDDFLIITYTKAAAAELRGKIASKLSERIAQEPENRHLQKQLQRLYLTKISTVHGFCGDLLREYAYRLDLAADFRVADENECRELRETVLADLLDSAYAHAGEDPDFCAFVDTQGLGRDDRLVPEILMKVYDSAMCHLDPEGWLEKCLSLTEGEGTLDAGGTVWGQYLMERLNRFLEGHIHALEQCVREAERTDGFEKVVLNLNTTLLQLRDLRDSGTWDTVVSRKAVDFGRLTFPRKCADAALAERIKAARNACKKGLEKQLHHFADPSGQLLEDLQRSAQGARGLVALVRQFHRDCAQAKKNRRVLDFSDLEHKCLDLVLGKHRTGPTAAAEEIGARFREIMVDEYQDSNGVQDAIFTALTRKRNNCFMVGDVKQSIYQFRLADPGIFLEKYRDYVPAEHAQPGQGRKVMLSSNFRSGGEVIEAVNHVFGCCMSPRVGGLHYGVDEALREGIPHEPLPEPGVELHALQIREDTYAEEAAFVAERIQTMLRDGTVVRRDGVLCPVTPDDIVILLRSPGSVGNHFQQALAQRGIRCASGGGTDLLKTREIGTFRALLQTISNPRQDIPLVAVLASPVFGFTADDLAVLRSNHRSGSIYDAVRQSELPKAARFMESLACLRQSARMDPLTVLLEKCLLLTRMDSIYGAMPGGEAKQANLQAFYQLAAEFEQGSQRDLTAFLEHLDALEEKGLTSAGTAAGGCVTIMSIHKSKGLEFPVVFLCGLSREFNRESLRAQILCDKELGIGLSVADTANRLRYPTIAKRAIGAKMMEESLSEELRVLYVAMTRARDRLIMTYAARNLESDLSEIALRLDFDGGAQLCSEAVCPGEWVLLAAMQRTEAGALFALGGRPRETRLREPVWKISVEEAPEITRAAGEAAEAIQAPAMPEDTAGVLKAALEFRYPHRAATEAPSKQTATGRKGRRKDEEAAQDAEEPRHPQRSWRHPSFAGAEPRGTAYGNAIHAVMQYIRYESCTGPEAVREEIRRLAAEGFITPEQGQLADSDQIAAFFSSGMGQKLRSGTPYLREFKFSILDEGSRYGEGQEGEQVLLQGVVDCALLEPEGITVLDFKTDRVCEETLPQAADRYREQVQVYADALSRIYEMPVKEKYLYFFRLNRFVEM